MPELAAQMNALPKIVFSRTLASADWSNMTLIKDDLVGAVGRMKADLGPDMVILGSGSIVMQLATARLIDTIQVVVNPVALGGGQSLLAGLHQRLNLTLTQSRAFRNGSVLFSYSPTE